MLQQISDDVGGGWGSMAGTMDPATSARRFLAALRVTNNPIYAGWLLTPTGREWVKVELSDPIAADVLRVQQPLANEARSSNYDASQVTVARAIVAQLFPPSNDWIIDMADQGALDRYADEIAAKVYAWINPVLRDRTVGSQSIYDEGRYNTQDVLVPLLTEIRNRLWQPGTAWDNLQDIRGTWLPDILAQLEAIERHLGIDRAPNPGVNQIPPA
jgi:hypothetical protein